ncbi:MAG TPA: ATP-binding protein [Edaphobacter sp.]|nr:ATP-binding protein [Edaphobacter sp.]
MSTFPPVAEKAGRRRGVVFFSIVAGIFATAILSLWLAHRVATQRLPYHDRFAQRMAEEWQPFGGTWEMSDGTIFNHSDERGAKLMTGSSKWSDYALETDLKMIGHEGDVGVIVRAGEEENGIDSYNGYYIGLRSFDSALIIGRADHGWMEGRPVPMPGGVEISKWYRLRIVAVGCHIGAVATNLVTLESAWGAFEEIPCVKAGRVGLRSMATGGAWRNFSVVRANEADWQSIRRHAGGLEHPDYPKREADFNRLRNTANHAVDPPGQAHQAARAESTARTHGGIDLTADVPIGSLRSVSAPPVRIRGVVTLTSPQLYVQDATGGIEVTMASPASLNLGDEVEITGRPVQHGYWASFDGTAVRLLWDRTLVVPLSISGAQAAGGYFNASLVEMRGRLYAKSKDSHGVVTLQLEDDSQTFMATAGEGLSTRAYDSWKPGSRLRVSGICVLNDGSPFTLLMRSLDDVEVLSGPPWWSGRQLARWSVPVAVLLLLGFFLYLRIERWKTNAIMNERERLAHEMHDTLAQSFAGVGFHLQGVRNAVRNGNQRSVEGLVSKLDIACDLVASTHREASASIAALHPDADEGSDLLVALERFAQRMVSTGRLPLVLERDGVPRALSLPVRDALFQIGREAITNVIRHGQVTRIVLRATYERRSMTLTIRDDGVGFDPEKQADFGVHAMLRRAEAIDAEFRIMSSPGDGTTVWVRTRYGLRLTLADWMKYMRLTRTREKAGTEG